MQCGVLPFGDALSVFDEAECALGFDESGLIAFGHESLDLGNPGDQFVFEAREEHGCAGITLTACSASQLVVESG